MINSEREWDWMDDTQKCKLILIQVEKIEYWKGDAYQSGDDIELALEEIKRLIGNTEEHHE
jgi:hypothetical protein